MTCQLCERELAPSEPVYRVSVSHQTIWNERLGWAVVGYVCEACKDTKSFVDFRASFSAPRPCQQCGRPVIHDDRRRLPKYIVCGQQCRQAVYNALAKEKRNRRPAMKSCVTCGEQFQPKRAHAVYCSNACRQKAHRRRTA